MSRCQSCSLNTTLKKWNALTVVARSFDLDLQEKRVHLKELRVGKISALQVLFYMQLEKSIFVVENMQNASRKKKIHKSQEQIVFYLDWNPETLFSEGGKESEMSSHTEEKAN